MFATRSRSAVLAAAVAALLLAGCQVNSTNAVPNPDRNLRKKPEQFKADASKRAYPGAATTQPSPFRGEVDYQLDVINIVNLSETDWTDVEVWANGQYVCFVPTFPAKMQRGIAFRILFSPEGQRPPLSGLWLEKVEIVKGGTVYPVVIRAAD